MLVPNYKSSSALCVFSIIFFFGGGGGTIFFSSLKRELGVILAQLDKLCGAETVYSGVCNKCSCLVISINLWPI